MIFPFDSLVGELREFGLVVGVLVGFGFGFVLERAGFGRAPVLAGQFYGYDMTVFKVMFGAIVTAMLGVVVASGLGLVDLAALSTGAVSTTYVWPMLFGGLLLGAGFIISGYCPGTSMVAMASGNIDGLFTVAGVFLGSMLFGELYPLIEGFYLSGAQGHLFLYEWLGLSPALLAVIVTAVAVAAFIGAEKVEAIMTRRMEVAKTVVDDEVRLARAPKRFAFGLFGAVGVVAIVTLLLPAPTTALDIFPQRPRTVDPATLAQQIFDRPWDLRIIDVRSQEACAAERVPGAECVPEAQLGNLGLAYAPGTKKLVLVGEEGLSTVPEAARAYRGELVALEGGHTGWKAFALTPPEPLAADATAEQREAYRFRASVQGALTGRPAAPPPAAPTKAFVPKKKNKEGGCG